MQISEYPTIPQAPADDDVLAIEVNSITYKVPKATLVPVANDLTTTAAGKVLDARQGKALNDRIVATIPSQSFNINSGAAKAITLSVNFRGLLFGINANGVCFMILAYCNSSGSTGYKQVMSPTNVTVTTGSDYTLTITNGGALSMTCGVFALYGTATV